MTYTIGQTVTVDLPTPGGPQRVTGTVANTLPAEHFEFNVLVVVEDVFVHDNIELGIRYGDRYVGWFAEAQLEAWQLGAAA